MNYIAEFKIKNENANKIQQILEVDLDYRKDTQTEYDKSEGYLIVRIICSNLVSLKKSTNELYKKLNLIEQIVDLTNE